MKLFHLSLRRDTAAAVPCRTRIANDRHVRPTKRVQRGDGGEHGAIGRVALVIENVHVAAQRPHLREGKRQRKKKKEREIVTMRGEW